MTNPKQLPCSVCGTPVSIPAKYARAKSATCEKCASKELKPHPTPEAPKPISDARKETNEARRWSFLWMALTVLCPWVCETNSPMKNRAAAASFAAGSCAAVSAKD